MGVLGRAGKGGLKALHFRARHRLSLVILDNERTVEPTIGNIVHTEYSRTYISYARYARIRTVLWKMYTRDATTMYGTCAYVLMVCRLNIITLTIRGVLECM